jgi:hypothetical protein
MSSRRPSSAEAVSQSLRVSENTNNRASTPSPTTSAEIKWLRDRDEMLGRGVSGSDLAWRGCGIMLLRLSRSTRTRQGNYRAPGPPPVVALKLETCASGTPLEMG